MKSEIGRFLRAVCLLAALISLQAVSNPVLADDDSPSGPGLQGSWAVQFTGTVSLPPPFNGFNGPFYRNARVVFDKNGNLQANSYFNYNGTVAHETFSGTYVLNQDGTFTITLTNLPVPFLPAGTPDVFTFQGVLANKGRLAKVVLTAVNVGGTQLPNIGSVIAGEFVKQ